MQYGSWLRLVETTFVDGLSQIWINVTFGQHTARILAGDWILIVGSEGEGPAHTLKFKVKLGQNN